MSVSPPRTWRPGRVYCDMRLQYRHVRLDGASLCQLWTPSGSSSQRAATTPHWLFLEKRGERGLGRRGQSFVLSLHPRRGPAGSRGAPARRRSRSRSEAARELLVHDRRAAVARHALRRCVPRVQLRCRGRGSRRERREPPRAEHHLRLRPGRETGEGDADAEHRASVGRVSTMTDPAGIASYSSERRGLLRAETRTFPNTSSTYTTTYRYDSDVNRSAVGYPSGLRTVITLMTTPAGRSPRAASSPPPSTGRSGRCRGSVLPTERRRR